MRIPTQFLELVRIFGRQVSAAGVPMAGRFPITRYKPSKRVVTALAASAAVLSLAGWVALSVLGPDPRSTSPLRSAISSPAEAQTWAALDPAALRPAEVRPALLCDYYEHTIEHAPPRDPSGCMQRRELNYTVPPNIGVLLRARLRPTRHPDDGLLRQFQSWEAGWWRGEQAGQPELDQFESLAAASSLPSDTLLDLGRAFAFLDSDAAGAAWYRAGIHKAERDDKDVRPGDPAARRLLNLLDQTKALWRLKDYPALEQRFAFAMRWNPPLSPEARRAGYLHAEMLFYQKKYLSAADAMLAVQAAHRQAGDLGALERSDLHEMDWVLGLLLRQANRHEMAIVYLRRAGGSGGEHAMWATRFLFSSLLELGRIGDAQDIYNKYAETYHPSERARTQMQLELDTATPNVEPVRQQGGSVPALGGAGPMTLPQAPYKETVP